MLTALQVSADDLDTLTRTLDGEARGEPVIGVVGVAWVVRNRVAHPAWWGSTVREVCLKPAQLSCWNHGDPNRQRIVGLTVTAPDYQAMRAIARAVMAGEIDDPTGGADHYEALGAGADWAARRPITRILGRHAFYAIGPEG